MAGIRKNKKAPYAMVHEEEKPLSGFMHSRLGYGSTVAADLNASFEREREERTKSVLNMPFALTDNEDDEDSAFEFDECTNNDFSSDCGTEEASDSSHLTEEPECCSDVEGYSDDEYYEIRKPKQAVVGRTTAAARQRLLGRAVRKPMVCHVLVEEEFEPE
jgi:hypothetical protein